MSCRRLQWRQQLRLLTARPALLGGMQQKLASDVRLSEDGVISATQQSMRSQPVLLLL